MKPYVIIQKHVGETPLEAAERFRQEARLTKDIPLAYAGRLDPMASGKLLILIGEECKKQSAYHSLDKAYRFEVLFGTRSDTGDVLGLLTWAEGPQVTQDTLTTIASQLTGNIKLPYPHFSSKTVAGKPLHVWTLEKRLHEIEIPTASTQIHHLRCTSLTTMPARTIVDTVEERIARLTPATADSKALGRDFRRVEVMENWAVWYEYHRKQTLQVATFECVCSSGTYMRSLAEEIGRKVGAPALAYSIHRTEIGQFRPLPLLGGLWTKRF